MNILRYGLWLCLYLISMNAGYAQTGFNLAKDAGFSKTEYTDFLIDNDTIVCYGLGLNNDSVWRPGLVLSKFDSSGTLLLSKIILHPPGDYYNIGKAWGKITKTADGGYAMTAAPFQSNSAVLIKTDANFEVEFIKEYPDTVNLSNYFYKLLETPEGYLLYGAIQRPDYNNDGFIRYVDKQGETIWFKYLDYSPYWTVVQDIKAVNDSVFLSVSLSWNTTDGSEPKYFPSFLYFDVAGTELGYYELPENPEAGIILKIINMANDSMLVYGVRLADQVWNTSLYQSTISKLNASFESTWVKPFGLIRSAAASVIIHNFAPTQDGHYVGAGETLVKDGDDPSRRVGWLYKFSAEGDSIWERKINAPFLPLYFTNSGFFAGVGVLSSGSIVAGGSANEGNTDYCWLVKVTNDGCLDTLYCQSVSVVPPEIPAQAGVSVYPNPAHDLLRIDYPGGGPGGYVRLLDMQGRLQRLLPLPASGKTAELPVGDLPEGLYLVQWFCNGQAGYAKVVIAH
jgi:hypothetical protein